MTSRYIPKALRQQILTALSCAQCGSKRGPFDIDHITPLCLGGTNEISNLRAVCRPCHKIKTGTRDIPMARKADKQRKAHVGLKKRKGRKLQGRGFDKALRKRMDGTVERRT